MSRVQVLVDAVRRLHEHSPSLLSYGSWPDDLSVQQVMPKACEASASLGVQRLRGSRATSPVIKALRAAAPDLEWRQTYSEEQVGSEFLRTYGFVELFGPSGQFQSRKLRGYIGLWGPGLTYDWHTHEAEELYFGLAGEAVFSARELPNQRLRAGDTRLHKSHQPHLMLTLDQPFLAYVLWRGAGMDGLPRMLAS